MSWFISYTLLFLVYIGLLRERRRTNAGLAELRARMLQVEELLIEVCFFLEEPVESRMDSGEIQSSHVLREIIEEEEGISSEPLERLEVKPEVEPGSVAEQKPESKLAPPNLMEIKDAKELESKPKVVSIKGPEPVRGEVENADVSPSQNRVFLDNEEKNVRFRGVEQSEGWNKAQTPPLEIPFGKHKRNQRIVSLFQQGMSVKEIAMKTGMGQGEVQLIVDLYSRR